MKHSEQDSGYSCREYPVLTLTHSLARTRAAWGITNRPGAILRRCMRARGIAHLLAAVCRIFARSAQNLAPAARAYKSKAIDAAADWEVAAGSVSTGDPAPTSAARSKQPSPTHAAPPGTRKTSALDNNNISSVGSPFQPQVQHLAGSGRIRVRSKSPCVT